MSQARWTRRDALHGAARQSAASVRSLLPGPENRFEHSVADAALFQLDEGVRRSVELTLRGSNLGNDQCVTKTGLYHFDDVLVSEKSFSGSIPGSFFPQDPCLSTAVSEAGTLDRDRGVGSRFTDTEFQRVALDHKGAVIGLAPL